MKRTAQSIKRVVTVADSIRMTKFSDPHYFLGGSSAGRVANFSPDGKRFIVVLTKGNLEKNINDYTIVMWRVTDLSSASTPQALLTMSSSSNRTGIEQVSWLSDNETLAFLGEGPAQQHRLYRFNIRTRVLQTVTRHGTSLKLYGVSPKGDAAAYVAEDPVETIWDDKAQRQGLVVTRQPLDHLIGGDKGGGDYYAGNLRLFFQSSGKIAGPLDAKGRIDSFGNGPEVSPNGRYIAIATWAADIPQSWTAYSDSYVKGEIALGADALLKRYVLVDARTGTSRVLLDAPAGYGSEAVWSPDERSIVLSNAYLPLNGKNERDVAVDNSKTFLVEVDVSTGKYHAIVQTDAKVVSWDRKTNCLLVEESRINIGSRSGQKSSFCKNGAQWKRSMDAPLAETLPEVILEEGINTPPRIVVLDAKSGQRKLLFDLNPDFELLTFAEVDEITWKGADGHEFKGGLYYPPGHINGKRYPLVIQTHAWNPNKFWIDGPWPTAFAAQALAGKNMFVLQAPEGTEKNTVHEAAGEAAMFEGAIDELDRKGLIDRERVGMIGFSRTCFHIKYFLTHSKYAVAAASVTDGVDAGYFQYLAFMNWPNWPNFYEGVNGGRPWPDKFSSWTLHSPGFALDSVRTPLRIVAPNRASLLEEWEWFAALTRLRKPVELIAMRDGFHLLIKPWERMISQQGNVDWFDFWLNGHEDPDPAKAEQYTRWRELRKLQEANQSPSQH